MYVSTGLLGCGRGMRQEYSTTGARTQEGFEVRSPMEGQAHRRSGAACIFGIGKSGGLTPPQSTQGSLEKEKGLVLGEAKSEVVVPGTPPRSSPVGGTHVPRKAVPRTTAKGVFTGRNRTLLLTSVVARLVL